MPSEAFHPMVVHFPIALLLAALLVETLALLLRKPAWHRISLWNLVLGTWGGLLAVVTGGIAASQAQPPTPESRWVLDLHSVCGTLAFALAVVVNGWYLAAGREMSRPARWGAWALLGITCVVTAFASHLGARLVYEFGVAAGLELP